MPDILANVPQSMRYYYWPSRPVRAFRHEYDTKKTKPRTTACLNLSPDRLGPDTLHAVMPLKQFLNQEGATPWLLHTCRSGKRHVVLTAGRKLFVRQVTADGFGEAVALGELPSEATVFIAVSPSSIVVMMAADNARIEFDSDERPSLRLRQADYPALTFTAFSHQTLTQSVSGRRLSGSYTVRSERLNETDCRALTTDALTAYADLTLKAAAAGVLSAPVFVRYRLTDRSGNTLFVGAPTLVSPDGGMPCCRVFRAALSADLKEREDCQIKTSVCRVRLSLPKADVDGCERLVIEASLPLHPFDFGGSVITRIDREGTASASVAWVMPGISAGMNVSEALLHSYMKSVAGVADSLFRPLMSVDTPFAEARDVELDITALARGLTAPAQAEETNRLITVSKPCPPSLAAVSFPHTFGATAGATAGETVVWGGIRSTPFAGYKPSAFFADREGEGGWTAMAETDFADGSRAVQCDGAGWGSPARLWPVLYYPSADAVKLTLHIVKDGQTYRGVFPLTPTADGLGAAYVHDSCMPFALTETVAVMPQGESRPPDGTRWHGTLALAPVSTPVECHQTAVVSTGAITALASSTSTDSAFQYAYRRLFVFTTAETLTASLTTDGRLRGYDLLDRRILVSADSLAVTSAPLLGTVAVLSGDLVALHRRKTSTLVQGLGPMRLLWNPTDAHLTGLPTDGSGIAAVISDDGRWLWQQTVPPHSRGCADMSLALMSDGRSLMRSDMRDATARVPVQWEGVQEAPVRQSRPMRPTEAAVTVSAADATMSFAVTGSDAAATGFGPIRLGSVAWQGRAEAPVRLAALMAPPLRAVTLTLSGTAGADFAVDSFEVTYIE